MAETSTHKGDLVVTGYLKAGRLNVPNGSVGDAQMKATDPIDVDKAIHRFKGRLTQKRGAAIAANTGEIVHVASAPGVVESFRVGVAVASVTWAGGGLATVDLKKNGVSILSAVITLDSSNTTAFNIEDGAFTAGAVYVADAVFEVVVTFTGGTGTPPQGLVCEATFAENPS